MAQISTDKPIKRGMPVSRSNGGVKRLKNITKQVHRYIGASSAVFIFLVSVSGLLLHYPGLLGGEAEKNPFDGCGPRGSHKDVQRD